ncbi:MAG: pilus assembly protein PilP [Gammaproteobacteria bacterium]|nr:pilus assembly protein PilP [Gammaproteobacteria bacterium]
MAEARTSMNTVVRVVLASTVLATASACHNDTDQLRAKIAEIKSRPGGRIEPLPEVKPYETFAYPSADQRSPFVPGVPASAGGPNAIRPDANRPREFLEQYSLDTLRMVGTLKLQNRTYGLVQTKDGLVHRVLPGNHLGQNDGRITAIAEGKISLIEIVPDGMGGFVERPAALALSD